MNACAAAAKLGWAVEQEVRGGDSILVRARDVLVSRFWESGLTDMLFVDSDISFEPETFIKIMSHPVELVGGAYRGRGDRDDYAVSPLPEGINIHYPSGIAEVRGIATGFLRITRAAVERLIKWMPEDHWYSDEGTAPGLKIRHFFDFTFDPKEPPGMRLRGEDYVFCDRFRAAGGKVWADCEVKLHHEGRQIWTGHFGDFLRRGGAGTKAEPPVMLAKPQSLADLAEAAVKDAAKVAA
jgi:hypothetical protein